MKHRVSWLFLLLLCGESALTLADVHDLYRDGVSAFKAGKFERALMSFDQAEEMGMRSPTLHYNLGVVHFKLGDLIEARRRFSSLAADPDWGAIAHYNLGLIAESKGDEKVALYNYRAASERTDSDKIRRLVALKLAQLDEVESRKPVETPWVVYTSLGTGFDDNVALTDETAVGTVSDQDDYFIESVGVASRYVAGAVSDGWRLDLGGYYRAHADLDDFNYTCRQVSWAICRPLEVRTLRRALVSG